MVLYFTGVDGAGKSTVINELKKTLNEDAVVIWARYESKIISRIFSPIKKRKVSSSNYNDMNAKDYDDLKSLKQNILKVPFVKYLIYYAQCIDYVIQLKKTVDKEIKQNKIVILDRYVLDFLVDQSCNYGDITNIWFTKRLLKRLYKVDYTFFLSVDIETSMKRKSDIPSRQYLLDRIKYYRSYSKNVHNLHTINNEKSIKDAVDSILKIMK